MEIEAKLQGNVVHFTRASRHRGLVLGGGGSVVFPTCARLPYDQQQMEFYLIRSAQTGYEEEVCESRAKCDKEQTARGVDGR